MIITVTTTTIIIYGETWYSTKYDTQQTNVQKAQQT